MARTLLLADLKKKTKTRSHVHPHTVFFQSNKTLPKVAAFEKKLSQPVQPRGKTSRDRRDTAKATDLLFLAIGEGRKIKIIIYALSSGRPGAASSSHIQCYPARRKFVSNS